MGVPEGPVLLDLPFRDRWAVRNSPANRVPSHGTHQYGLTYAIDFVAVDSHARSAPYTVRSLMSAEAPGRFVGFGAPILSPVAGRIVAVHDGEQDHRAHRGFPSLAYALGQRRRVARGGAAVAGNHVVIAMSERGPHVWLTHLQCGTIRAALGMDVQEGDQLARCGNSGNSYEPHLHVQITDLADPAVARGLPWVLRRYRVVGGGGVRLAQVPSNGQIVFPA